MTEELRDIEQDLEALEDGPDRGPETRLRVRRELTCFCCGARYRARSWQCCSAPPGTTSDEWGDQWHRFKDPDGRKRSHCPRHPCPECLAGGAEPVRVPGEPEPKPSTVTPFDPDEQDASGDWKERAAGDADRLEDEVGF